jgi:3-dehydroquinate synthase
VLHTKPAERSDSSATYRVAAHKFKDYEVVLVDGLAVADARDLRDRIGARRALLVTTPRVARLYARAIHRRLEEAGIAVSTFVLPCSEATKCLDQVATICREALRCGLDRKAVVVGVGGGVCTDIVTMAASWVRRGLGYIKVPTTLIGLVDAGIGIKGGVNFEGKKNYLGCFYPPESVLLDPAFLGTLPKRHIRTGLAEIVKVALACDRRLFELVERDWRAFHAVGRNGGDEVVRRTVWQSTIRLLEALEPNLHEDQAQERLADLGHTFSPALESASGFAIAHGEAVAIDIALSAALATHLGLLASATRDRILRIFKDVGLPVCAPELEGGLCRAALAEAALHRGGRPNLVLPVAIGRTTFIRDFESVSMSDLDAAIRHVRAAA